MSSLRPQHSLLTEFPDLSFSSLSLHPSEDLASTLHFPANSISLAESRTRDSIMTDSTLLDPEKNEKKVPEWKPQREEYLVMMSIATISIMVALDATILVSVLPTLAKDLNGTATEAFWVGTSYLLTSAVFQPFLSALSDIFGRQEILIPSIVFFTIGSALCGWSQDFTLLLVGRCVQGIGGGGIITLAQVIFADMIPLRQRPKWFSIILGAWALGTVLGPLLGGVLVEKASWRWVFWINLPFCVAGLIMAWLFVRMETVKSSLREKLLRVDWLGGFLFISGLTSFLIGLSWGGLQFSWTSYQTLLPIILGIAGVIASLFWEKYGAREPFLRRSLFYSPSAVAGYLCALLQGLLLFCALYYVTFYFLAVQLKTPIIAGVDLLPVSFLVLPGSVVVSALITRLGHFRWAIWAGYSLATLGNGLLLLLKEGTPIATWVCVFVVLGVGHGMVLTSVNFGIQSIARAEDCGRAASMYSFTRTLGMTIGVAVGGTVFQNLMQHKLRDLSLPVEIAQNAEGYIDTLKNLADTDPVRIGVTQSYVHGFTAVFAIMTAVAGLGLLSSLIIKSHSMDTILKATYRLNRQSNMSMSTTEQEMEEEKDPE